MKTNQLFQIINSIVILSFIHIIYTKKAICILTPDNNSTVSGNATFIQSDSNSLLNVNYNIQNIDGTRAFHIHQNGNITGGCLSAGGHYNPLNVTHGGPDDTVRHLGDFGNLTANGNQINTAQSYSGTSLFGDYSIIGKSCVLHSGFDDKGKGNSTNSPINGNAGIRIGCGIIYEQQEIYIGDDYLQNNILSKFSFVWIIIFSFLLS